MYTFNLILGALIAVCSAFFVNCLLRKHTQPFPLFIWYLLWFLPFIAGGFHTYIAAITASILLISLFKLVTTKQQINIGINANFLACIVIVLGYCISPLWAADKGMAVLGILRYLPVLLLSILLMQYTNKQKQVFFSLLPVCGAVMTIICSILWIIPTTRNFVVVNGRLSGFLQYPNTFAAFLLTGVAVLGTTQPRKWCGLLLSFVLIAGILLSGSRTSILLLAFLMLTIPAFQKRRAVIIPLMLTVTAVISAFLLLKSENQITFLGRDIGSLFVRILYYKDAIPLILQHPFGLGYMGYRALETTFQTSRYTVSFVHSGLLQMLLDIGWIPSLLFAIAILKTLFSPKTESTNKMVLLVLSAHTLVDFDLQFFLFWAILLMCFDFDAKKVYKLQIMKPACFVLIIPLLIICIWFGLGDWLYQTGNSKNSLKIVPFHTDALASELTKTADPDELDRFADKILLLNPTCALAYSAKSNVAYARGQVLEMIRYKEKAIQLAPYSTEEYCDYIEKLYTILEIYVQNGDRKSAEYCLKKLIAIPLMIENVSSKTDPLAYKTGNNTELTLPEPYQCLIAELIEENPTFSENG